MEVCRGVAPEQCACVVNRIPCPGYSQTRSGTIVALPPRNSQAVHIGRAGSGEGIGAQGGARRYRGLLPRDGCADVNAS